MTDEEEPGFITEEEEPGPNGTCHPSDIPCDHIRLRAVTQDSTGTLLECLECHEVFDVGDVDDMRRIQPHKPEEEG